MLCSVFTRLCLQCRRPGGWEPALSVPKGRASRPPILEEEVIGKVCKYADTAYAVRDQQSPQA